MRSPVLAATQVVLRPARPISSSGSSHCLGLQPVACRLVGTVSLLRAPGQALHGLTEPYTARRSDSLVRGPKPPTEHWYARVLREASFPPRATVGSLGPSVRFASRVGVLGLRSTTGIVANSAQGAVGPLPVFIVSRHS